MILKLRGLVGEWEGERPVFLGAVEESVYEGICMEDEADGTDRWGETCERWRKEGLTGITEVREVDFEIAVPDSLFDTPRVMGTGRAADG